MSLTFSILFWDIAAASPPSPPPAMTLNGGIIGLAFCVMLRHKSFALEMYLKGKVLKVGERVMQLFFDVIDVCGGNFWGRVGDVPVIILSVFFSFFSEPKES